jgi:hypothetical protein
VRSCREVPAPVTVGLLRSPRGHALLLGDEAVAWSAHCDHEVGVGCLEPGQSGFGDAGGVVGFGGPVCAAVELKAAGVVVSGEDLLTGLLVGPAVALSPGHQGS